MNDIWQLFPYPTLTQAGHTPGSVLETYDACANCVSRPCSADDQAKVGEVRQCRYGVSYSRLDDERLVVGVLCPDLPDQSKRARKRLRHERERHVPVAALKGAITRARSLGASVVADYRLQAEEMLARMHDDPALQGAVAEKLRRDFADNLSQSHDFLQLVKLVRGHAEALLHDAHPSLEPADAADRLPIEGAIYYSTELMLLKMDSMVFLNEVNRANGGERKFQIHRFALKYLRIYQWQARQKKLRIHTEGQCYAVCFYNDEAIGAILQALLDNLVKYAPANSRAAVVFEEFDHHVDLSFTSLGPRIDRDERSSIFLPKYRGRAARRAEESGLGVGLATARNISDTLGLDLRVEQADDPDATFPHFYPTTFALRLQKVN